MERAWLQAELALRQALAREQLMARTDSLTGLYNRRHFLELALHECAVAKRYGMPLAALLLDVDHFKQMNDTSGHQAGDEILRRIAQTVLQSVRKPDIAARYGGQRWDRSVRGGRYARGAHTARGLDFVPRERERTQSHGNLLAQYTGDRGTTRALNVPPPGSAQRAPSARAVKSGRDRPARGP